MARRHVMEPRRDRAMARAEMPASAMDVPKKAQDSSRAAPGTTRSPFATSQSFRPGPQRRPNDRAGGMIPYRRSLRGRRPSAGAPAQTPGSAEISVACRPLTMSTSRPDAPLPRLAPASEGQKPPPLDSRRLHSLGRLTNVLGSRCAATGPRAARCATARFVLFAAVEPFLHGGDTVHE